MAGENRNDNLININKKAEMFRDARRKAVYPLESESIDIEIPTSNNDGDEQEIDVNEIVPSPYQHRVKFDEKELRDLANGIKERGLINAITVREKNGGYELIAGERRLRAVRDILGEPTIRAKIRNVSDIDAAFMCFDENYNRKDLSEYEVYKWVSTVQKDLGINQREIGKKLRFSEVRISQIMSVGKLPQDVIDRIRPLKLAENHIRALRKLQKTDLNMMYKLLDEIESAASVGKPMTSDEVLKRCNALLEQGDKIKTPIDSVSLEFIKKISNVIARFDKFTDEEKKQLKARIILAKNAIHSFEELLNK